MALNIETFSNAVGGNAFYKAVMHPLAVAPARELVGKLAANGAVAIYDPLNQLAAFDAVFPLREVEIAGIFVQSLDDIGRIFRNHAARPVTELSDCPCDTLLIAAFDAAGVSAHVRPLMRKDAVIHSFDALRLPGDMLSDKTRYLSNLNFATNFVFFRDDARHHTRLTTVNYWSAYGGKGGYLRCILFDSDGRQLADWKETLPASHASIVIDSADVRKRFSLTDFMGQLFVHVVGAAGHDIVKYALDTYGDTDDILSCTHDANAWPSNRYAGLPAPDKDEEVVLWVQNSHPNPIPAGDVGLNVMGDDTIVYLQDPVDAFATRALSVSELLPRAHWPQQIEIRAGKHFVRPRYEVTRASGRVRIAHPNVEREDLKLDLELPKLSDLLGKGFILPAPVWPTERWTSLMLPTPMSTVQTQLPVKACFYNSDGQRIGEHALGNLKRRDSVAVTVNDLAGDAFHGCYGHMELEYDFAAGDVADGWLHALFRYEDRVTGHAAETSFGAHVFNTLMTYKGEPQSYKGPPPGLSTRLFLRLGRAPLDTVCHLIYPASRPWRDTSDTALILMSGDGAEVAKRSVKIACSGSLLWRASETFRADERETAGEHAYIVIRDTTCRLFGYHGLVGARAFSLDHMFGF